MSQWLDALSPELRKKLNDEEITSDALASALPFEILRSLGLSLGSIAALRSDPQAPNSNIAEYLARSEARSRDPWRLERERYLAILEASAAADSNVADTLSELAKAQRFGPDEAMILTYLAYGGEEDRRFFLHLLAHTSESDRLKFHNFHVAENNGSGFLEANGAKIAHLRWPLFPPGPKFAALNARLLNSETGGDATKTTPRPNVFRQDSTGGEAFLPIQQREDGSVGVDATCIETAVSELYTLFRSGEADKEKILATIKKSYRPFRGGRGRYGTSGYRGRGRGNQQSQYPPANSFPQPVQQTLNH